MVAGMIALSAVLIYLFLPRPIDVELAAAVRGPLEVTIDEDGKTRIRERYVVSAPLSGQMSRIDLHPGDPVEAGKTLLATIEPVDPALLTARDRAETEARVKRAEAEQLSARASVEQANEEWELANHNFERSRTLLDQNAIPQADFDAAEHRAGVAREQLNSATVGVQIANYELELAQAALVRSRTGFSEDAAAWRLQLFSPVDGELLRVFQEDSSVVSPGMRLLEVGNPADLEVEVDVLSTDAVQIDPGASVWIEHWGGRTTPLVGRVRRVAPAGFTKVSALGVEEQRVLVFVDLVDPYQLRQRLGDAYRVEARIVVWKADDVLKVPAGALFRNRDGWAVYRFQSGRAVLTAVDIGQTNGLETQIVAGLQPGDQVIPHPTDKVADGVRVQPH